MWLSAVEGDDWGSPEFLNETRRSSDGYHRNI